MALPATHCSVTPFSIPFPQQGSRVYCIVLTDILGTSMKTPDWLFLVFLSLTVWNWTAFLVKHAHFFFLFGLSYLNLTLVLTLMGWSYCGSTVSWRGLASYPRLAEFLAHFVSYPQQIVTTVMVILHPVSTNVILFFGFRVNLNGGMSCSVFFLIFFFLEMAIFSTGPVMIIDHGNDYASLCR